MWIPPAKTEESVEEKMEMTKETIEKISIDEEETNLQKIEEKEIETKKEYAEESGGAEGNPTIHDGESIVHIHI